MVSPVRRGPIRSLIESEIRSGSSDFVIARRYNTVAPVIDKIRREIGMAPPREEITKKPELLAQVRETLRESVVQIKPVCGQWIIDDELNEARRLYDEGRIEVCTGRLKTDRGDYLVLYGIPRSEMARNRRKYFSVVYEG